jgi:hypothetical protein
MTRIDSEILIAHVRRGVTVLGAVALLAAGCQKSAPTTTISSPSRSPSSSPALSVRDRNWQQDVAYLARELPLAHAGGLAGVRRAAWLAAAWRLQGQVPRLTDGQAIVGMARMVAMLHDDETQLILPAPAAYPFAARWIGSGIYLMGAPAADRWLLGARLVAVDGHPVREVVAKLRAEIDYQDVLRLPHYSVLIEVTTAVVNPAQTRYGIPDIAVAPTPSDWLTGRDPVLAKALDRGRTRVTAVSLPS